MWHQATLPNTRCVVGDGDLDSGPRRGSPEHAAAGIPGSGEPCTSRALTGKTPERGEIVVSGGSQFRQRGSGGRCGHRGILQSLPRSNKTRSSRTVTRPMVMINAAGQTFGEAGRRRTGGRRRCASPREVPSEEAAEACLGAPGSRTGQGGRPEQPDVRQWPAHLRPRDQRVRRLVLFGAAAGVQPHRRAPLPDPSRTAALRARDDQPAARRRPTRGLRSGRCRAPQSGAGGRHSARERRAAARRPPGQLADGGAGPAAAQLRTPTTPRELRDHAMVALLLGCGLRRGEVLALQLESIQQREEHWVIADLVGKGGHVRTVPCPRG